MTVFTRALYPGSMAASGRVRDRIEEAQSDPRAWLHAAERQKRAADLVGSAFQNEANAWLKIAPDEDPDMKRKAFELGPSAMMLIGYAIEVLAKALIVARGATTDTIKDITKRHLDVALLDKAELQLQDGEPYLVERLYHWIRWSGRYPAPSPADGEKYADSASHGGPLTHPGSLSTDDYRQACELYDRIHVLLSDSIPGS